MIGWRELLGAFAERHTATQERTNVQAVKSTGVRQASLNSFLAVEETGRVSNEGVKFLVNRNHSETVEITNSVVLWRHVENNPVLTRRRPRCRIHHVKTVRRRLSTNLVAGEGAAKPGTSTMISREHGVKFVFFHSTGNLDGPLLVNFQNARRFRHEENGNGFS